MSIDDRQRRVEVARERGGVRASRPASCGCSSGIDVSSLATECVITDGWLRAARIVSRTTLELARRAGRGVSQQRVAVVDGRLAPDEDALLVEAVEQPLVEQVVRARDVRAERLELVDDASRCRRRSAPGRGRGCPPGSTRRAGPATRPLRRSIPSTTVDRAQADAPRGRPARRAPPARVRDRARRRGCGCSGDHSFGSPSTGTAKRTRTRSPGRSARGVALPSETVAVGRLQRDGDRRLLRRAGCGSRASRRRARVQRQRGAVAATLRQQARRRA